MEEARSSTFPCQLNSSTEATKNVRIVVNRHVTSILILLS